MIEIINLCKSFGGHQVLDNLNLTINTGETTVIIGRSGCGKSVLLKNIIGILKPDSGQVIVDSKDVTKMDDKELNALRLRFGMLFQGAILSTQPYGVDTASGVESKPGFKDPEKVNAFIRAVHSIRSQVPL